MKTLLMIAATAMATLFLTQDPKPEGETSRSPLQAVDFLVGKFAGKGKGPMGAYREEFAGEWAADRKLLIVRGVSRIGSQKIFEDVRVFVHDDERKRIRMHQFTSGTWTAFDVQAANGTAVMTETAREGIKTESWHYTYRAAGKGLEFALHTGEDRELFVSGSLDPVE